MGNGILIIDDDDDEGDILQEGLMQVGVRERIVCQPTGEKGLKFLEDHKADLPKVVIIDMNLPQMDGIAVLKNITGRYTTKTIMYTTFCNEEMVREVKGFGAIDCVKKGTSYTDNLKFAKRIFELLNETD